MQLLGGVHKYLFDSSTGRPVYTTGTECVGESFDFFVLRPLWLFAFEDTGPGQGLEVILSVPKTPASCLGPGLVTWAGSGT